MAKSSAAVSGWISARIKTCLVGTAVSWNEGKFDYEISGEEDGEYELDLAGVHPYFSLQNEVVHLWANVGYGEGELTVIAKTMTTTTRFGMRS